MFSTQEVFLIVIFGWIGYLSSTGVKSQFVRLLDILFYGPFLLYIATLMPNNMTRIILLFIGATTITYNLRNFITDQKNSVWNE